MRTGPASQPPHEVTAAAQAGSHPAGVCLVGLFVSLPRCSPGGRGPRRAAPVRRAGRSTVQLQ